MGLSKKSQHIMDVVREMKIKMVDDLQNNRPYIPIEEVDDYVRDAEKRVAERKGITVSTVKDAVNRGIGLSAEDFYDSVKEMINHPEKEGLTGRVQSRMQGDDSEWDIEKAMREIFPF